MVKTRVKLNKYTNGLKALVYPMPQMSSVSLGVWVKMGGRFEPVRYKGISHFLEHMVFKGSRKYGCRKIKELLEGVGGTLNAFTSEENTCYLVKIPAKHLHRAIDVLSDMTLFPTFPEADFEREKLVVFEEIRMYMDLPQSYVIELAQELLWEGHNLGRPLAGTMESVGRISREVMLGFQSKYYRPNNMAIVMAGHVSEDIFDLVDSIYRDVEKGKIVRDVKFSDTQSRPKLKILDKDTEQTHLCLVIPVYSYTHPMKYALDVLNIILGGNMSSRLFNEVREKRGLAYHISSVLNRMKDTGGMFIKAGTEHKNLIKTVEVILRELDKIAKGKISTGEFKRAKEFLLGQLSLHLEDTMENMLMLGSRLINTGHIELPSEIMQKIEAVTFDDVKTVASEILNPTRYNLAVIGPCKDNESKIMRTMKCC